MPTPQKEEAVKEVAQSLTDAKSVFLADFTGLNVEEVNALRRSFKKSAVEYRVVKNTLARRSVKSAGCEELLEYLEGPTAMAFGMEDPVAPAKVIKEFSRTSDKVKIKACLFEGVLIGRDRVSSIADLPTKEELLGQLVGVLNAPIANLASSLNGVMSKLVFALDAVRQNKEEQGN